MPTLTHKFGRLVRALGVRVHDVVRIRVHAVYVQLELNPKAGADDAVTGGLDDGGGSFMDDGGGSLIERGGSDTLVVDHTLFVDHTLVVGRRPRALEVI